MNRTTRLTTYCLTRVTILGLGLLCLGAIAAAPALAQTATDNMTVTGSVTASCVISAGALTFGEYDAVTTADVDAEAALTVTCTAGTPGVFITLGQGSNADAGSTDAAPLRQLAHDTDGTAFLSYNLYHEAGRTTVWGNTEVTAPDPIEGTGAAQNVTVFGRIPDGQTTVPAGSYSDTVVATVNW